MKLKRLLGVFLLVPVLLFSPIFLTAASAGDFDATFTASTLTGTAGASEDVTLTNNRPIGSVVSDRTVYKSPVGWDWALGSSIGPGVAVGSGTFTPTVIVGGVPTPFVVPFTMTNDIALQGHKLHFKANFPPYTPIPLDVYVDGDITTGHEIQVSGPVNAVFTTPITTVIKFYGLAGGVPLQTNPVIAGDYVWQADFHFGLQTVTKEATVSIPGSVTNTGSNVNVPLSQNVAVQYGSVSSSGVTTLTTTPTVPPEDTGQFQLSGGLYYDFNTTATIACPCTVTLPYNPATTPDPKIYHLESGIWVDSTTAVDTVNHTVTGTVSSFSFFAPGQPEFGLTFLDPIEALLKVSNPMSLQNNRTLPVNFTLADLNGDFVSRTDVSIQVVNNSTNTLVTTIPVSLKNNHYKANLDLKSLGLTVGNTYKLRVVVGNTVNAPTPLFIPK